MPSKIVPLVVGEKYHVFNRGVDKRTVFHDVEDYLRFYESLFWFNNADPVVNLSFAKKQDYTNVDRLVAIEAYALVDNHFHLIIEQLVEDGVSMFMKRISAGYTGYYNEKYERSGSLFQGKYKRVHIESDQQFNYLLAYVHNNYLVHGLQKPQHMYQSSSLHIEGSGVSKLLSLNNQQPLNIKDSESLARQVFAERKQRKNEIFE